MIQCKNVGLIPFLPVSLKLDLYQFRNITETDIWDHVKWKKAHKTTCFFSRIYIVIVMTNRRWECNVKKTEPGDKQQMGYKSIMCLGRGASIEV